MRLSRRPGTDGLTDRRSAPLFPYVRNRQAVNQNVHDVVYDYDEPCCHPGRRVRTEACRPAFGPGRTAGPWPVLQPRDVARELPAIDDEMSSAYYRECGGILRNEQEGNQVEETVHQRRPGTLRLLDGHPFTLQYVIAYGVSY